jgi:hypothetical protein
MRLRLISDGGRAHALVTEQGDVVGNVTRVRMEFGAHSRPVAEVTVVGLEVELRDSSDVPSLRRPSGGRYA